MPIGISGLETGQHSQKREPKRCTSPQKQNYQPSPMPNEFNNLAKHQRSDFPDCHFVPGAWHGFFYCTVTVADPDDVA
jgi:hypothetical protein